MSVKSYEAVELSQAIVDSEHLKLLSWGYVLEGGLSLFRSAIQVLAFTMVLTAAVGSSFISEVPGKPLIVAFMFFAGFAALMVVLSAGLGGLKLYVSRCILQRRRRVLCLVVAALSCLSFPYGTVLSVGTFLVLQRESVMGEFSANERPVGAETVGEAENEGS